MSSIQVNNGEVAALAADIHARLANFHFEELSLSVQSTNSPRFPFQGSGSRELAPLSRDEKKAYHQRLFAALNAGTASAELILAKSGEWELTVVPYTDKQITLGNPKSEEESTSLVPFSELDRQELRRLWDENADVFESNSPATDAELAELAEMIGRPVPEPLVELWKLSNGAELMDEGMTQQFSIMSISEAMDTYDNYNLNPDLETDWVDHWCFGALQESVAHPGWIPFAHEGSGDFLALDTTPGPYGTPGQIVEYGDDHSNDCNLVAASLLDFLTGNIIQLPPQNSRSRARITSEGTTELNLAELPADTRKLRVTGRELFDASDIAHLSQLEDLEVRNSKSANLAALRDLPIKRLILSGVAVADLTGLSAHQTLKVLHFAGVENMPGADQLPGLELVAVPVSSPDTILESLAANKSLVQVEIPPQAPLKEVHRIKQHFSSGELGEAVTLAGTV